MFLIRSSSAVERGTVNPQAAGSNPASGAMWLENHLEMVVQPHLFLEAGLAWAARQRQLAIAAGSYRYERAGACSDKRIPCKRSASGLRSQA
jgi:hypothetical protein